MRSGNSEKKGHLYDHTGLKPSGLNYHCLFISVFHELHISRRGSAAVIFLFQSLEEVWLKKLYKLLTFDDRIDFIFLQS